MIQHFNKIVTAANNGNGFNYQITVPLDFKYSLAPVKFHETLMDLPAFCVNYVQDLQQPVEPGDYKKLYIWNEPQNARKQVVQVVLLEAMKEILNGKLPYHDRKMDFFLHYFGEHRTLSADCTYFSPERKLVDRITRDHPLPQLVQTLANGVIIQLWETPVAWYEELTDFDFHLKVGMSEYVGVVCHPDYEVRDFISQDLIATLKYNLGRMLR